MDYTKCDSASDFEAKFRSLVSKLDVVEGEETWQQIDTALKGLTSLVQAGAARFEVFVPTMKQATKFINNATLSERTRLSGTALVLLEELARQMETRFHPLCDLLFPSAMKVCGRANKVFVTRGVKCLTAVITYAHAPEQTQTICYAAMNDANKTVRSSASKLLMSIVSCCTVPELSPHIVVVEKAIASGIVDAHPDARTTARQTYEIYVKRFADRVEQFHAGLSSTAKKYLKIVDKSSATGSASSGRPQNGTKPSLVRLFGEDTSAGDKSPPDSAHASASPPSSSPETRAPSPAGKDNETKASDSETKAENTSKAVTPVVSGDEGTEPAKEKKVASANQATTAKASQTRAKRGTGLSFSSLSSAKGGRVARTPHAIRPQSRNLVTSRMEEALRARPQSQQGSTPKAKATRAQRPARSASVASAGSKAGPPKRMTLRSDTKGPSGPGYLRATASSSKRVSEPTSASRGTKRRRHPEVSEEDTATTQSSTKAARRTSGRRRSAAKH
ncbi:hypothetical protein GGF46_001758 [Coemansia sp. RSA 552]|nr:hypothetical protein GGF46_001758 [Coemansia sp. RSA 552]